MGSSGHSGHLVIVLTAFHSVPLVWTIFGEDLNPDQRQDLLELCDLRFSELSGHTYITQHNIKSSPEALHVPSGKANEEEVD